MVKKKITNLNKDRENLFKWVYGLAAFGTIATFFGHGMWAVGGKESFAKLLTGSFQNVLGIDIDIVTATNWVRMIGRIDIAISVVLTLAAIGYLSSSASSGLKKLATSNLVKALYVWAIFWGFATAASRVTAAGEIYPEIWDLVERGPNFAIPAIALILTVKPFKK